MNYSQKMPTPTAGRTTTGKSLLKMLKMVILVLAAFFLGYLVRYLAALQTQVPANQTRELVDFVDNAASLLATKGEAAFSDFRQKGGVWWQGDRYIFVYDMDANTLVLPPTPEIEGTNRWTTEDSNGVFYVREMAKELQSKNYAWIMYSYPKPGEKNASPKVAYVKKVNIGNKTAIVGSGIYY